MKVTTIEETNDITTMRLDELFGSLRTFELSFAESLPKKKNSVAFQRVSNDTVKSIQKTS